MVYLDDNASEPDAPAVADAMAAAMQNLSGNASSSHAAGVLARKAVEDARGQLAELLDVRQASSCSPQEPRNQTTSSFAADSPTPPARTASSSLQANTPRSQKSHTNSKPKASSTFQSCAPYLRQLDLKAFAALLDDKVAVVSIVGANSETGVISPLAEVADLAHGVGAVVHSDVTQLAGPPTSTLQICDSTPFR